MRVLLYGDSNTWGYDPRTGLRQENRFVNLLRKRRPDIEWIDEGLCGRTLALDDPYRKDVNGAKTISMILNTHMPIDLCIIFLGVNDLKRQYHPNQLTLEKGIQTLLFAAMDPFIYRKGYPKPKFWVICPSKVHPACFEQPQFMDEFGLEMIDLINQSQNALKKGSQRFDARVIANPIVASQEDGIHLDQKGHEEMASLLENEIMKERR